MALLPGLVAVVLLASAPAQGAKRLDFGDAPDGQPADYVLNKALLGRFPSRTASGGPSHPGNGGGLVLGLKSSGERDSRQVDRDTHDDGLQFERLGACEKTSKLLVYVNAKKLSTRFFRKRSKTPIYVNTWFDWNHDGDFADGSDGCAPEWGVQNLRLSPRELSRDKQGGVVIRFRAGRVVDELWARVTLTLGETAPHAGARGTTRNGRPRPYRFGETEDYLLYPSEGVRTAGGAANLRTQRSQLPRAGAARSNLSDALVAFFGGYPNDLQPHCYGGEVPGNTNAVYFKHDTDRDEILLGFSGQDKYPAGFSGDPITVPLIEVELPTRVTPRYQLGDPVYAARRETQPEVVPFMYLGPTRSSARAIRDHDEVQAGEPHGEAGMPRHRPPQGATQQNRTSAQAQRCALRSRWFRGDAVLRRRR